MTTTNARELAAAVNAELGPRFEVEVQSATKALAILQIRHVAGAAFIELADLQLTAASAQRQARVIAEHVAQVIELRARPDAYEHPWQNAAQKALEDLPKTEDGQ